MEQTRKEYQNWEQKLFDFVAQHNTVKSDHTIRLTDTSELNIHYLYSSPEAESIEVSLKSEKVKRESQYILIKILDNFFVAPTNTMPNKYFKYIADVLKYREQKSKMSSNYDKNDNKYANWEQKLFNFIAAHESSPPEFTIQFAAAIELRIHYLYSSPEVSAIKVSSKSERFPNAAYILIKVLDDFYAAYPNELSMPSGTIQNLFDVIDKP